MAGTGRTEKVEGIAYRPSGRRENESASIDSGVPAPEEDSRYNNYWQTQHESNILREGIRSMENGWREQRRRHLTNVR